MVRGSCLVVLAGLLAPAVRAQEQYPIRFKLPGKGHESTTEMNTRIRISLGKWDAAGKQVADDLKVVVTKMAYSTLILEEQGATSSRVRRHCGKVVTSIDGGPEQADEL